jgi:hypothetical protein
MRHGMTKNHGSGDMGFFPQLLDWLVEQVGVAPLAIFRRKRYSDRRLVQASGHSENPQMKMQRE